MNTSLTLLNQLTAEQFLAEYWQKKPLLIRQAIPQFAGLMDANELAGLACEEEAQSRIIQLNNDQWTVKQGPFKEKDFAKLPERDWTLLVQGVNHFLPEAAELLAQFNFIPHARLDDLMVSYAPDGGGVGPHVDSYDVFLLQGSGKRHWKISTQTELSLLEDAPLRILKHFETEQEWVLEAGDMLYLPPQVAHWGLAVGDDCMTYSIGFRAPKTQELAHEFLSYLQDHLPAPLNQPTLYQDPELTLQTHPAEISANMVNKVHAMLKQIESNPSLVGDFLGLYLTEPKPQILFEPAKKLTLKLFLARLAEHTLYLSLPSQMLFWEHQFYLNGERIEADASAHDALRSLANQRYIDASTLPEPMLRALANALHAHYLVGYVTFD
jgi:50S ribosomal protein L16 3-hydroxylase